MSEKLTKRNEKIAATICYRNIKKDYTKFEKVPTTFPNAHLELGEKGEAVIVEDRSDDWFEIAQQDADKCGLSYVLELAAKNGEDIRDGRFAFKDSEALDTSGMDPLDPQSINETIKAGSAAMTQLQAMASELGITVDELIDASLNGTISGIIDKKQSEKVTEKGEE